MEDEATLFHDHSTLDGRLSLFLHRLKWKYLIPPALFLLAFAGIGVLVVTVNSEIKTTPTPNSTLSTGLLQLAPGNSPLGEDDPALDSSASLDDQDEEIQGWTVIKQPKPGVVVAEGCENGLYAFEGFDSSVEETSVKSLRIRSLVIDAPALSESLANWTNLESLVIENVWVNGNFSRVYLPSLKKFIYHQYRNGKTDQYKQQDTLKQTLFFDKGLNETWNLNRDLLNLNVTVQINVEGTKILDIEPDSGEININTHECQDMLKNYDSKKTFNLTSLSLSWCPVGASTINKMREHASTLKYLFLNNAVPGSTAELAEVTSALRNLKELHIFQRFHCDWPGYEIFLNVSDLSPSLETLSVTNLDLSFTSGMLGASQVKNLSLDQYVGKNVVDNFEYIFPNLQTVALFNVTRNLSYPLLQKVLRKVRPALVIVTDFQRVNQRKPSKQSQLSQKVRGNANVNNAEDNNSSPNKRAPSKPSNDVVADIEELLDLSGISQKASSFVLELCKNEDPINGKYLGNELTSFQRNFHRFIRLAFKKIDTYTDYVIWDADADPE